MMLPTQNWHKCKQVTCVDLDILEWRAVLAMAASDFHSKGMLPHVWIPAEVKLWLFPLQVPVSKPAWCVLDRSCPISFYSDNGHSFPVMYSWLITHN